MLLIGINGEALVEQERTWLLNNKVSGVILFARNFSSREQVTALIDTIRSIRPDPFLIAVDQEGGPVQRFKEGFTKLPALSLIGDRYAENPKTAIELAEIHAWVMASEMRAIGIDLSFAPVVDLARGNRAIGTRAFHKDPEVVSTLTLAYLRGMKLAGMAATLKHFPGHGSVLEDTHVDRAIDNRPYSIIAEHDLIPFQDAIAAGAEAVMMAHVDYPQIDTNPAGYSKIWIQDVLRNQLKFQGAVLSDDIGMAAAHSAGGIAVRISAHLEAGCDFVLVCDPQLVPESLKAAENHQAATLARITALTGLVGQTWAHLTDNPQRDRFIDRINTLT
jgi:beta-N-acetylhexosaminidase